MGFVGHVVSTVCVVCVLLLGCGAVDVISLVRVVCVLVLGCGGVLLWACNLGLWCRVVVSWSGVSCGALCCVVSR